MKALHLAFVALIAASLSPAWADHKAPPPPLPPVALVWGGPPDEPMSAELQRALVAAHVSVLPGGALAFAGQTVALAQRAVAELRCGEALPALDQAEGRLLGEVPVADARALLSRIESLVLLCADRLGDPARAARAADRLLMTGAQPPPDVALVLRRYRPAPVQGPPPPPDRVDTDPRGAQVIRDLLKVGASPTEVEGGSPDTDMLDVELSGFRKVHRPLGAGEQLALGLRPEDRLPVLVDAVAARPLGSEEQGAAITLLSRLGQLGGRVVVIAPQQRGGVAVAGERLRARVFDLSQTRWLGAVAEVPAGTAAQQAQAISALALGGAPHPAVAARPAAPPPQEKTFLGLKLNFTKTKWYSWVIAGGVAALIAGLLIAEHYATDSVTVHATK